jgi:pyruvate formate-lyase activating enzyme-like uncharacterized protein
LKALIKYQNSLVESNRKEYGALYDSLNFVNYYQGLEMEGMRNEILNHLNDKITWDFKGTKTDAAAMSPGCRLCGMGQWSCLFINGKCNCNCFYCPAPQTDIGQPVTQTLTFEDPIGYADYIKKMGFKGVSFSGGEPFLTFDKVKRFLATLRHELPADIYIWMYTNGTRVTQDQLRELAALGLNEIRYDIGATDYNLKPVKQAIGIIPIVSVEIPAVPDELETIKRCVKELAEAGLSYLNLHQLRLTPHNLQNLKAKGYAFAHGQRVTVPASELAALEIIKFTKDNNIALPVNYCSFVYKNRFQKSGLRKKLAPLVMDRMQSITENGYLRNISVDANNATAEKLATLSKNEAELTYLDEKNDELKFHESLLNHFADFDLKVRYTDVRIRDGQLPLGGNLKNIVLADGKNIHIEWADVCDALHLPPSLHAHFTNICKGQIPDETFDNELLFNIKHFEQIEEGLSEIY